MKTYSVLYAEDVSHYGSTDIAAENDAEAIAIAKGISDDDLCNIALDPDHGSRFCKRIVHILDPDGEYIAADIPLDGYTLIHGQDKRLLCEAAETMLLVLERAAKFFRDHVTEDHPLAIEIDAVIRSARGQP